MVDGQSQEVAVRPAETRMQVRADDFMPVFNIEQAVARQGAMSEFIGRILRASTKEVPGDYGEIPGASKQKVLLKPGAEKLCTFFGLSPLFTPEESIEDWSGKDHGDEPLFYYRYKCQLWRGDRLLAEAIGSCNSREKKYRFRNSDRLCPSCAKPTIIKGREEYGGGWVCFAKKGGCGAKFPNNDPSIVDQQVGQVKNPDIYDVVNTCQKMAQKRALVAAVLIGTNASDSFTQDLEEEIDTGGHAVGTQAAADHVRDVKLAKQNPSTSSGDGSHGPADSSPPTASAGPVPKELEEIYRRLPDKRQREALFRELCDSLVGAIGEEAVDELWIRTGRQHGDPDKNLGAARIMAKTLFDALISAKEPANAA